MKGIPLIQLYREPTNIRDENAIVVEVLFDEWHPIGYIPGKKVPNVTMAMNSDKITEVKLKYVIYHYIPAFYSQSFCSHSCHKARTVGERPKRLCIMRKYK